MEWTTCMRVPGKRKMFWEKAPFEQVHLIYTVVDR